MTWAMFFARHFLFRAWHERISASDGVASENVRTKEHNRSLRKLNRKMDSDFQSVAPRSTSTMSDDAPVSSSSAVSSGDLITLLNHNDVTLGRGAGPSQFIGNLRFRSRVEERQEEYLSLKPHKHPAKAKISRELVDQTHALGGRFLKPVGGESPEEVWYEVTDSVAVEKCKQALRDSRRKERPSGGNDKGNNGEKGGEGEHEDSKSLQRDEGSVGRMSSPFAISLPSDASSDASSPFMGNLMPVVPSMLIGIMGPPCVEDMRFQAPTFALQQQATTAQPVGTSPVNTSHFDDRSVEDQNGVRILLDTYPPAGNTSHGLLRDMFSSVDNTCAATSDWTYFVDSPISSRAQSPMPQQTDFAELRQSTRHLRVGEEVVDDQLGSGRTVATSGPFASDEQVSASEDMSKFLLSSLMFSGKPRLSEEQVEMERAMQTDEERAETLSDLFGKQCEVNIHRSKRARRDLEQKSIAFLVNQMRLEIERIPEENKRALLEAQMKCRADEFSDARLERFLRCEGKNVKLGAQRFVNYWESRREVFGPDKFVLRMTLSEALCDDLAAVEAGLFRPLPHLDASGRQLLLLEPSRHTREGYTSESMLRAVWYLIEALAQENTDVGSGIVLIQWLKDFTLWDFDHGLYNRISHFDKSCWPVKRIAAHGCCPPSIYVNIIKPVANAFIDKYGRCRVMMHDVPESQVPDILSSYGILKNMLPSELGGTVLLDQAAWIASRRAAELEGI